MGADNPKPQKEAVMKNKGNYDHNIYNLLNSNEGYPLRRNLLLAKRTYEKGKDYYWVFEEKAISCLDTMLYCKIISGSEYSKIYDQIYFLIRLYKGVRGSELGRKDVPNE